MPTLAQVRDAIDDRLVQLWKTITGKQYKYYTGHGGTVISGVGHGGKYWQGLRTHVFTPKFTDTSGEGIVSDRLDDTPTDQTDTNWGQFNPALVGLPLTGSLQCDFYSGPIGDGYVASVWVQHDDVTYSRSQNYGPETWRTVSWHRVITGAI